MIAVSRFTRTLGTLLQSGVPTLAALDIVKSVVGNTVLANAMQQARENVREGEPIADPLRRSGLFPPVVVQMVAVGEKSGELEKMLLKISDSFDRTVETRITGAHVAAGTGHHPGDGTGRRVHRDRHHAADAPDELGSAVKMSRMKS